jgi:organic radical activating enzyme
MITITPVLEVYITNVCNLSCRGCNRFNNYNFKGHQRWADHAVSVEAWSRRLTANNICIIGGEPTLNPDLELWASNLRRLWPNSTIMIQSNGTYKHHDVMYFWDKYKIATTVSLHDPATAEDIKARFTSTIDAFVFHQSAVIENNSTYTLHKSDPVQAFGSCDMKHDATIFNGKLYKCPSMALLPEFDQQFNLQLDQRQHDLLHSFTPLSADCSEQELQQFIASKDTPISQCEFCPSNLTWQTALGEFKDNLPNPFIKPLT